MHPIELASPSDLSARARAAEICAILAAAIVRSSVASAPQRSDIELGFVPDQRVHTTPYQPEKW